MAVVIVDRRTVVDTSDTTTGWTGNGFGVQNTDVAEGSGANAESINISSGSMYYTAGASVDLSNTLVYVFGFNNALQDTWDSSPPPVGILIGDGTDRIAFNMAGSNKKVFAHSDGPVNWQSLVLDGSKASELNTAGLTFADSGSFVALNLSAITQFGCYFETLSKALGGGYNVSVDIIRYGNDGLYILGGSASNPGVCTNIAEGDRSIASLDAHGIFREYAPTAFGVQGPLTFGGEGSQTTSYFEDTGVVIVFEDRDISNDKYYFNIAGLSTTTNYFKLSDSTITTAGPFVNCGMGSTSIDYLEFDAVSFVGLGGSITFPSDTNTGAGRTHIVNGCSFNQCREIFPKSVVFTNNVISGYGFTFVGVTTAAVIIDEDANVSNWSDLSFTSSGSGHAIGITTTGTYNFTNISFSGYSGTPGSNLVPNSGSTGAAVYNNSGGIVTINVSGGTSPSVRNGVGSTTNVIASATVNITGLPVLTPGTDPGTEIRVFDRSTGISTGPNRPGDSGIVAGISTAEIAGTENHYTSTFSFSVGLGATFDVRILNERYVPLFLENRAADTDPTNIPVDLKIDRVFFNPS